MKPPISSLGHSQRGIRTKLRHNLKTKSSKSAQHNHADMSFAAESANQKLLVHNLVHHARSQAEQESSTNISHYLGFVFSTSAKRSVHYGRTNLLLKIRDFGSLALHTERIRWDYLNRHIRAAWRSQLEPQIPIVPPNLGPTTSGNKGGILINSQRSFNESNMKKTNFFVGGPGADPNSSGGTTAGNNAASSGNPTSAQISSSGGSGGALVNERSYTSILAEYFGVSHDSAPVLLRGTTVTLSHGRWCQREARVYLSVIKIRLTFDILGIYVITSHFLFSVVLKMLFFLTNNF